MIVEDVLAQKGRAVHTIEGKASLAEAAEALHRHGIGCVAVLHEGGIRGLLGEREIAHAIAQGGARALLLHAHEVMRAVSTCSLSADLGAISRRMTDERVRHLLVMDGGDVAGIISVGDVLKRRLSECQLEMGVLRDSARARLVAH